MIFWEIKKLKSLGGAVWPFVFVKDIHDTSTIHHEIIHIKQQKELWWIGFFVLYLYFLIRKNLDKNPFELEAYEYESKPEQRKPFGWRAYVKSGDNS